MGGGFVKPTPCLKTSPPPFPKFSVPLPLKIHTYERQGKCNYPAADEMGEPFRSYYVLPINIDFQE